MSSLIKSFARDLQSPSRSFISDSNFEVFNDIFSGISRFIDDQSNLFNREFKTLQFPPANVRVDEEGTLYIDLALAGYSKDQISIDFKGDQLIVELLDKPKEATETQSDEKTSKEKKEFKYLVKNIKSKTGKYYYELSPKLDVSKIKASYSEGILNITIPLTEEQKLRKILIE